MKSSFCGIILLFATLSNHCLFSQSPKKTVAVLNFVNAGGVDNNEISILTDRFNNTLFNTNVYKVLEREKMDAILKEQDFKMTDNCNSTECAVQVGQLLGVEVMVAGKVGKFGQTYTIDIRMIDVSTGELLKTSSENYEGKKEGLLGLIVAMATAIANKAEISIDMLEQELTKLQQQNKQLEQEKNQKNIDAQQDNLKKQEELKKQLVLLEQKKKLDTETNSVDEVAKQKALEEQKKRQELYAKIEKERQKQFSVRSSDLTYQEVMQRIGELQEAIKFADSEIEKQKQKAVMEVVIDNSPRGEFETPEEFVLRLKSSDEKPKKIADEYEKLKVVNKAKYTEEIISLTKKRFIIGKESLRFKLKKYDVIGGYFPVEITEIIALDSCVDNSLINSTTGRCYVIRDEAKKIRENELLLDIRGSAYVDETQKLKLDRIELLDGNKIYEFAVDLTLNMGEKVNIFGSFIDHRDGKTYKTIKIGNQIWMAENLNFDFGVGITCYNDEPAICEKYGRLYTWEAAKRAVPEGWHLPSKSEFESLLKFVQCKRVTPYAGLSLNGEFKFDALFGGGVFKNKYSTLLTFAYIWTSSASGASDAWGFFFDRENQNVGLYDYSRRDGLSVRCIKD